MWWCMLPTFTFTMAFFTAQSMVAYAGNLIFCGVPYNRCLMNEKDTYLYIRDMRISKKEGFFAPYTQVGLENIH